MRQARRSAGLTLREVARVTGTSESNVSAYERNTKRAGHATLRRLTAALDVASDSVIYRHRLTTAASTAAGLRRDVKAGSSHSVSLRRLRELIGNSDEISTDSDWALFAAEPSTTGDPRWDAALAGAVDWCADRLGRERPHWTRTRAAEPWLFIGSTPALHALAFAASPPQFSTKGVFVDPDDLVLV